MEIWYVVFHSMCGSGPLLTLNGIQQEDPVHPSFEQTILMIVGAIVAIPTMCGVGSLLTLQTAVTLRNTTTNELQKCKYLRQYAASVGDPTWNFVYPYDLGRRKNCIALFGTTPINWILPIPNSNGNNLIDWPLNPLHRLPYVGDPGGV